MSNLGYSAVAPFTGAWIEIAHGTGAADAAGVAPFTGAWIEMLAGISTPILSFSRSLHGSVD